MFKQLDNQLISQFPKVKQSRMKPATPLDESGSGGFTRTNMKTGEIKADIGDLKHIISYCYDHQRH